MKRALLAGLVCFGAWACVTVAPSPPSFHIEDVPPAVATRLGLDERIAADDAWADLKEGRADAARKIFLKLGPASPVSAVGLGYVNLYFADLAAAESDFKASLERFPDMTPANIGLAQVYESRGEKDLAFTQYREVLKREPGNRWAKPRLEALRDELSRTLLEGARTAAAAGRKDDARRDLLKVLFYDPASAEANYLLGMGYLEDGNLESARVHLEALSGDDAATRDRRKKVLRALAEKFFARQEFGRSLDSYEKLAELEPQDKEAADRVKELKEKLGVYELPSQYGLIPSLDAIAREDLAALVAVKFKDFLDVPERQTRILVDVSTSWAQRFIIQVASLNIMGVFDNHTFQPRRIINRAELAESLAGLIEFLKGRGVRFVPLLDTRRIQIADVPPDSYFFAPITKVVSYQVMDLTPQRLFEPERTVTGREAERTLDLVLGLAK